jgi:hypothetical protein
MASVPDCLGDALHAAGDGVEGLVPGGVAPGFSRDGCVSAGGDAFRVVDPPHVTRRLDAGHAPGQRMRRVAFQGNEASVADPGQQAAGVGAVTGAGGDLSMVSFMTLPRWKRALQGAHPDHIPRHGCGPSSSTRSCLDNCGPPWSAQAVHELQFSRPRNARARAIGPQSDRASAPGQRLVLSAVLAGRALGRRPAGAAHGGHRPGARALSSPMAIMRDLAWLGLDWDEGPDRRRALCPYVHSASALERYGESHREP